MTSAVPAGLVLPSMMRSAVYYGPDDVRIESRPTPEPGVGELLVKMEACGICGSDVMDWYAAAKAPVVLGHEPIGTIVAVGPAAQPGETPTRLQVGDRVFVHHHVPCGECTLCRGGAETLCASFRTSHLVPGGFSEYILVPAVNALKDTLLLPPQLDVETATLIEPLACVVRGQRRVPAPVDPDALIAIIGLGQIGLLHVALALNRGAGRVAGLDPLDDRIGRAEALGAIPAGSTAADFFARFGGARAARVFIATGAPAALETALEIAGEGAWVEMFAPTRPEAVVSIKPHDLFFREVTMLSSYSAGPSDTREALRLLLAGVVDARTIITHRYPLEETGLALATQAHDPDAVKVVVRGDGK